jgi:hypothetical protein
VVHSLNGDKVLIEYSINEPLDASKHGPSTFQNAHGDPVVEHDYPEHQLAGRHGARQGSVTDAYGSGVH